MTALFLKDFPPRLKAKLKARAALRLTTLRKFVIKILSREVEGKDGEK